MALACALIASAAAADPPDPPLWGAAREGMSLAQVRGLTPAGHAPSRPDQSATGAFVRLEAPTSLDGQPAVASYFFVADRLEEVGLSVSAAGVDEGFVRRVEQGLDARLGRRVYCQSDPGFTDNCVWMNDRLAATTAVTMALHKLHVTYLSAATYRQHFDGDRLRAHH
jgi:hypothetical protein